jgi:hypothetical protein
MTASALAAGIVGAAMNARRSQRDTLGVRRLFALSCDTGALVAAFTVTLLWVARGGGDAARFLGALSSSISVPHPRRMGSRRGSKTGCV